jgi:hypothetical protein
VTVQQRKLDEAAAEASLWCTLFDDNEKLNVQQRVDGHYAHRAGFFVSPTMRSAGVNGTIIDSHFYLS